MDGVVGERRLPRGAGAKQPAGAQVPDRPGVPLTVRLGERVGREGGDGGGGGDQQGGGEDAVARRRRAPLAAARAPPGAPPGERRLRARGGATSIATVRRAPRRRRRGRGRTRTSRGPGRGRPPGRPRSDGGAGAPSRSQRVAWRSRHVVAIGRSAPSSTTRLMIHALARQLAAAVECGSCAPALGGSADRVRSISPIPSRPKAEASFRTPQLHRATRSSNRRPLPKSRRTVRSGGRRGRDRSLRLPQPAFRLDPRSTCTGMSA